LNFQDEDFLMGSQPDDSTLFLPPDTIEIRQTDNRGLGVFALRDLFDDELIERSPVLLFPENDLYSPEGTAFIADYVFVWGGGNVGLSLGFGSLYNHSFHPNAIYEDVEIVELPCKQFVAIRDISRGEEITINYNGDPEDQTPVGFDVL